MIDVVCFKWGDKFGPEYVNNLYHGISRNTTIEHNFICYTDDPTGVECETRPFLVNLPVWWYIIGLTNPAHNHNNKVVYFDLDTIITGNVDHIIGLQKPFATISDMCWPQGLQTAFVMYNGEIGRKIWNYFTSKYKPADYPTLDCNYKEWGGTNQFLEECMGVVRINQNPVPAIENPPEVVRLQNLFPGQCVSYKEHIKNNGNRLPEDARLVFFHGNPMPHEQKELEWMKQHWNIT